MSEDLGTEELVNGEDQITSDTPTKEGKPQTMPGRQQDHNIDQPTKQSVASFGQDGVQLNRSSTAES